MGNRRIVITGFMGSGKTSVARTLGRLLNRAAIDLDEEITRLKSSAPGELITLQGEEAFREIETDVLRQVLDQEAKIISLGGGTWTVLRNRELLATCNCLIIWLDVPFETCWRRITDSGGNRPLAPDRHQAKALYKLRQPAYKLAALRVKVTDEMGATEVAELLKQALCNLEPKEFAR